MPFEIPSFQKLRDKLARLLDRQGVSEYAIIMFMALLVGALVGLAAVGFRILIEFIRDSAFKTPALSDALFPYHIILIPFLGGALVGPISYFFSGSMMGHSIPDVMEAVALRGGRIPPKKSLLKAITSAVTIGSGGSVGREGPIVFIGSALASAIGQAFKFSDDRVRNLVACGAAAAIAASFNAPIAASLFALEVILQRFLAIHFGAVVISAVTANVIALAFEGNVRVFELPRYELFTTGELTLYTLLGLIAAISALFFSRLLYFSEDIWERIPVPVYLKPALGGLLLGIIGFFSYQLDGVPRIFSGGYETINEALAGDLLLEVVLVLFFLKMIATALTLGSGGSGGVFAPSLFMGAMLGGIFGLLVQKYIPWASGDPGSYAMVGMAAFFSGATHAPITGILILFEMTGDYRFILPLMVATVMSSLVSRILSRESIYTLKLTRKGIFLQEGQDIDVMQGVKVSEAMTTDMAVVSNELSLEELAHEFEKTHHHGFPVVNKSHELVGVVSLQDLERARFNKLDFSANKVSDIATCEGLQVAYPYEPMWIALRRLVARDIGRLPVLEKEGSQRLVGMVRRSDIIHAYDRAITKRAREQHESETLRLKKLDDSSFVQVDIAADSPVVGRHVKEISLPEGCLVVSVRRHRQLQVAHGYTVLQAGDRVTVFAQGEMMSRVKKLFATDAIITEPATAQTRHLQVELTPGAACVGRKVRELKLPIGCILVSIRRGSEVIVPHGDTVLEATDMVELFGGEKFLAEAERMLKER